MENNYSILIIEDQADMAVFLDQLFNKQERYQTFTVPNGFSAMTWMMNGHLPDLILFSLTGELDEAVQFIHQFRMSGILQDVPLLVLAEAGLADHQLVQKVDAVLEKPFNPNALEQLVKGYLHPKAATA